ncbi:MULTISPECIES: DinB family protein [unclassified Sinorhizobium]|uniref:DinB family protein n=1 Tax=unclassified Sinorhizobium TaxID=2613772 RepID=UPI0024C4467E|nr:MULTISPECIES: DinB family protein [unclassified Sinorhizobium]MDK1373291.1 DinB family protein [Sinorhizobium sp. 6-70]MDK1482646.1 DinB family protein [Sinorhizobium sp. 6-117]
MRGMTHPQDLICRPYRQLARNARLANARLDRACMALKPGEWEAPRTSFFPSLKETMVHLLNADRYYIDTLRGERPGLARPSGSRSTAAEFSIERAEVDEWLVNFSESLTAEGLLRTINIPWPERTLTETVADTLLHVFMHGQHHRGQIHSMLSGTSVPPPQIDEFILTDNGEARVEDLNALGWTEARLTR